MFLSVRRRRALRKQGNVRTPSGGFGRRMGRRNARSRSRKRPDFRRTGKRMSLVMRNRVRSNIRRRRPVELRPRGLRSRLARILGEESIRLLRFERGRLRQSRFGNREEALGAEISRPNQNPPHAFAGRVENLFRMFRRQTPVSRCRNRRRRMGMDHSVQRLFRSARLRSRAFHLMFG